MELKICCEEIEEYVDAGMLTYCKYRVNSDTMLYTLGLLTPIGLDVVMEMNYCPFCGEKVIIEEGIGVVTPPISDFSFLEVIA